MRTIERTSQFKRDYKRESRGRHRTYLDARLALIVEALANDQPLEPQHHDHALSGEWGDHHDCHVKPDLVADLPEVRRRHPAPGTPRITCRTRFMARPVFSGPAQLAHALILERDRLPGRGEAVVSDAGGCQGRVAAGRVDPASAGVARGGGGSGAAS